MTALEQCKKWVKGNSIHDTEKDACCPDFSCCNKNINTPVKTKERFLKAFIEEDDILITEMLMMFLGEAFKNVYIAEGKNELHS